MATSKRKLPETSLEAWKSITPEQIDNHHKKILVALAEIKKGSSEQVSSFTSISYWQTSRRMSELEAKGLIYKTGEKTKTRTGRNANVYSLVTTSKTAPKKNKQPELFS